MPVEPKTKNTGSGLRKKTRRPRPANAIQITVWDVTGATLPEDSVRALEAAVERVTLELFNDGQRLLTQTNRG